MDKVNITYIKSIYPGSASSNRYYCWVGDSWTGGKLDLIHFPLVFLESRQNIQCILELLWEKKKLLIRLIVKNVNYFWETSISSTLNNENNYEIWKTTDEHKTIMTRFGNYHFLKYIFIYITGYIFIVGLIIFSFPHRWLCMKRIKIVGTTSVYFAFPHDVYFWTLSVKVHKVIFTRKIY